MSRSKLADRATRRDRFHQQAKREGFLARACYKLSEIDGKFRAAVARRSRAGSGLRAGLVAAVCAAARRRARACWSGWIACRLRPGAAGCADRCRRRDDDRSAELRGELPAFDVVLSDMAPDTSGIRQPRSGAVRGAVRARARAGGGAAARRAATSSASSFQGPDFKRLIEAVRARFELAKTAKPAGSRQISIEQYVIGKGLFRGAGARRGQARAEIRIRIRGRSNRAARAEIRIEQGRPQRAEAGPGGTAS